MEFVVRVLLYITCLCFQGFVFCEDYAEMGGLITFTPSIRGKPVEILWKHNGDKVVEYDNREIEEFGSFKDRVVIDFETGQLTIKKLTSQDSGQYQSDITINGKVQSSRHTLTVLDVLPDPRVTCAVNKTSNLQELLCSVDYKTQLQYKWRGPNVIDHPGVKLTISEQQKNSDSVYSCTVKNEVSSKTTNFNLQHCVTGAAVRLEVIIPVLIVILLLIFLIILVIFISRRRKLCKREAKESKQRKGYPDNGKKEEQQKLIEHQHKEKGQIEELENGDKMKKTSDEHLNKKLGEFKIDGNNDTNVKTPGEKNQTGNKEAHDQQYTDSKMPDKDKGSDNKGENGEKAKSLNHSGNEDEQCSNEKRQHTVVLVENASSTPDDTQTKLQEGQEEEEERHIEKPKEQKTCHAENNGKVAGEQSYQQNTESPENTHQDLNRQKTSPAQSDQCRQNHEEEKKPEKRNESGETSDQQPNEDEVAATNEDEQNTGANTQEKYHKETRESHTVDSSLQSGVREKDEEDTKTGGTQDTVENNQHGLELQKNSTTNQTAEDEEKTLEEAHEGNKALSQKALLPQNERPDEENRSDSPGVNEKDKSLNPSGNEGEQCNYENSLNIVVAEGNASSKPDDTLTQNPPEDQDKVTERQREKPGGQKTDNAENTGKVAGEQNEEENGQQNTEGSILQPAVTEENKEDTKTRGTRDTMEKNQNANEQKELDPEKDNMAHQTAEDEKTKQEENHVENTDSASEKQTIQNNSDALSSQNERSADTEKKSVKPDNNKDNNEATADHKDDDVESPRKEETTGEKSENYDDNNGEGVESSESKQDMKESNNPPDAGIDELLQDNEGKNPDHEQKIDDRSVSKDEQHETQSDNFQNQELQNKQNSTERENKPQHEISPERNETDRKNSELEEEERQRLQK